MTVTPEAVPRRRFEIPSSWHDNWSLETTLDVARQRVPSVPDRAFSTMAHKIHTDNKLAPPPQVSHQIPTAPDGTRHVPLASECDENESNSESFRPP